MILENKSLTIQATSHCLLSITRDVTRVKGTSLKSVSIQKSKYSVAIHALSETLDDFSSGGPLKYPGKRED